MKSLYQMEKDDLAADVDARVIQAGRAKYCDVLENRLRRIARLSKRIGDRETLMGSDDIEDLLKICQIAGQKP